MSALVFELKQSPDQRLDLSPLTPAGLKDLKAKEIEALVVGTTRNKLTVGDLFKVKGKDVASLRFAGTDARCDKIGGGLTDGKIVVDGDVGAYLGTGMKRRQGRVKGNAGVLAAATMTGGAIAISRATPVSAPAASRRRDARHEGGLLTIGGNAGPMLGERARRGSDRVWRCQAICRRPHGCRHHPHQHRVGRFAGYGLRRGSLILLNRLGNYLDLRRLRRDGVRLSQGAGAWLRESGKTISLGGRARLMGDMSVLGRAVLIVV